MPRMHPWALLAVLSFLLVAPAKDSFVHSWRRLQLSAEFFAEGANPGDLNRDGNADAIAGPYWHEGPSFSKRHELHPPRPFDPNGYSDNFFVRARNGDGSEEMVCSFKGQFGWAGPAMGVRFKEFKLEVQDAVQPEK